MSPGNAQSCCDNPLEAPPSLAATEGLLISHYDRVFRYAFHLLGCRTTAEDIAQEVFLRAHANAQQLRSPEAALGWLLSITRNEVARWCSKSKTKLSDDIDLMSHEQHEQFIEDHEWIHHSVQQLPMEFRLVVLMFYFEHKSYTEISDELKLPMGTVMSRLNRARSHLRQALDALSLNEPNGPSKPPASVNPLSPSQYPNPRHPQNLSTELGKVGSKSQKESEG